MHRFVGFMMGRTGRGVGRGLTRHAATLRGVPPFRRQARRLLKNRLLPRWQQTLTLGRPTRQKPNDLTRPPMRRHCRWVVLNRLGPTRQQTLRLACASWMSGAVVWLACVGILLSADKAGVKLTNKAARQLNKIMNAFCARIATPLEVRKEFQSTHCQSISPDNGSLKFKEPDDDTCNNVMQNGHQMGMISTDPCWKLCKIAKSFRKVIVPGSALAAKTRANLGAQSARTLKGMGGGRG